MEDELYAKGEEREWLKKIKKNLPKKGAGMEEIAKFCKRFRLYNTQPASYKMMGEVYY